MDYKKYGMNKREIIHELKYGTLQPKKTDYCPNCGEIAYAYGVEINGHYYYDPMHCECGWSEIQSILPKEMKYIFIEEYNINKIKV